MRIFLIFLFLSQAAFTELPIQLEKLRKDPKPLSLKVRKEVWNIVLTDNDVRRQKALILLRDKGAFTESHFKELIEAVNGSSVLPPEKALRALQLNFGDRPKVVFLTMECLELVEQVGALKLSLNYLAKINFTKVELKRKFWVMVNERLNSSHAEIASRMLRLVHSSVKVGVAIDGIEGDKVDWAIKSGGSVKNAMNRQLRAHFKLGVEEQTLSVAEARTGPAYERILNLDASIKSRIKGLSQIEAMFGSLDSEKIKKLIIATEELFTLASVLQKKEVARHLVELAKYSGQNYPGDSELLGVASQTLNEVVCSNTFTSYENRANNPRVFRSVEE